MKRIRVLELAKYSRVQIPRLTTPPAKNKGVPSLRLSSFINKTRKKDPIHLVVVKILKESLSQKLLSIDRISWTWLFYCYFEGPQKAQPIQTALPVSTELYPNLTNMYHFKAPILIIRLIALVRTSLTEEVLGLRGC